MWYDVGTTMDFRPGRPRGFVIHGRAVAVLRLGEEWHAFSNRCPHNGQRLEDGGLSGTVLTCRWHGWRFDVTTGLSPDVDSGGDGPRLRIYPVRVTDGVVAVLADPL